MNIDVVYLAWNRVDFTKFTLPRLLEATDWTSRDPRRLYVYVQRSEDRLERYVELLLEDAVKIEGFSESHLTVIEHMLGSPVAVMNDYMARCGDAAAFAKIDSDIVVPDGWLDDLESVMERNPRLELLGTAPGFARDATPAHLEQGWMPSTHIGGVGLMRTSSFTMRPAPQADGRFGFTEWQHHYRPTLGWIAPGLRTFELDQVPVEPWASLSARYVERGWQRHWPPYSDPSIWEWAIQ